MAFFYYAVVHWKFTGVHVYILLVCNNLRIKFIGLAKYRITISSGKFSGILYMFAFFQRQKYMNSKIKKKLNQFVFIAVYITLLSK